MEDRPTHEPARRSPTGRPDLPVPSRRRPPAGGPDRSVPWIWIWLGVGLLAYAAIFMSLASRSGAHRLSVPYSVFSRQVDERNVATVVTKGSAITGTLRHAIRYGTQNSGHASTAFYTRRPEFADDQLLSRLLHEGTRVQAHATGSSSVLGGLLQVLLPILLIAGLWMWMMRHAGGLGGAGALKGMGDSHARRYQADERRTTFADVAGIDEATDELQEVVDFLRHPDRYRRLGARIPRGVLLSGPPGTGKTLLARAVAGEADVPFFSVSASEFVEKFVGVGASRVRDLFVHAKQEAPAIVFIDELDAIGRRRGGEGIGGANDEREQTLNQILTEMDGFTGNEGVIVLAATNRPEILDGALLRAGRFDRRIAVNAPDLEGRRKILAVHAREMPLDDDVDLAAIAADTPGMVGADLANLVNEAALGAARRNAPTVTEADFTIALERILLGAARRIVISEPERRRTAYHESGHALLGMLLPGADPVRKISIIPRGHALGVTFQSPGADRYGYDESYLHGRLVGLLGGRAAERLIYGQATTGAESDLEQATALARQMVGRWGMSPDVGLITALPAAGEPVSLSGVGGSVSSEHTQQLIDEEVKRITDACYEEALRTLSEHRPQLDRLATTLLRRETLDEADAYAAAGIDAPVSASPPAPGAAPPAAVSSADAAPLAVVSSADAAPLAGALAGS